jgi:hypothetical protein
LYSDKKPTNKFNIDTRNKLGEPFPGKEFPHMVGKWKYSMGSIFRNEEGSALSFYPSEMKARGDSLVFKHESP